MAILDMISGSWMSQAIYVAAKLGIAEILSQGPKTSEQVASSVEAHADSLHRLLRALAALDLCSELDDGVFALTPLGSHLRAGVAGSVRSYALHWGGWVWPVRAGLFHSVKTGKTARSLVTRKDAFESLAQNSEAGRVFNEAMIEISCLVAAGVVRSYDFSGIGRLVDVGGGHGELLGAILRARPTMRGVLFDQPHVLEGARKHLEGAGVADRCEVVPGSFFDSVPGGADGYLLKSILHDWNDDRARAILLNCRRAMVGQGKLVVVERVLPKRMQPIIEHRFMAASDLGMMVTLAGRERTETDFRTLFDSAGFVVTRIASAALYFSVIEGQCV
jgi:hypothetical protein